MGCNHGVFLGDVTMEISEVGMISLQRLPCAGAI